jgi:hypothetical protein
MMEWIVIGLAFALASGVFGVPYALLCKPWRTKRLAYWLMARWPWYQRHVWRLSMRRMTEATVKVTASLAGFVEPMKRMGQAIEDLHAALIKAGQIDG